MGKWHHRRPRGITTTIAAAIVVVIIVVAGVATYFLLVAPATKAPTTSATKTVQIVFGATLSMTGPLQAFGQEQNWTLSLAVQTINKYGGIPLSDGSRGIVKLVVLDDKTDPTIAQSNLQTLVSQYHTDVIMGELGGVQDSVAQQFASRNQIPYIGPVYTSVAKSCVDCSNAWIFSPFHNETNEAHIFFDWFRTVDPSTSSHNVTIAFFGEGDPAAQANNLAGEAYARALGYSICACSDLTFRPGSTTEMSSFILAAKSAGAEAIYGLPIPPDAVLMVNTARQLGYVPKAWLLTRGTAVAPFAIPALGGAGNLSAGVMSAFPWQPSVPYVGKLLGNNVSNSDIVSKYQAVFNHPPTLEGVYFSEALIAANAIQKAGVVSPTAIRSALLSTTFETPMGQVSFTPGGQWIQSGKFMLMMQWQNLVVNGQTIQALQVLLRTSVATTNYIIYPFSFTNQAHQPWPP